MALPEFVSSKIYIIIPENSNDEKHFKYAILACYVNEQHVECISIDSNS